MVNNIPQTEEELAQAGYGDIEYAAPYLEYLDRDPLARLGFEPSKTHFANPNTYDELNIRGVYNPPVGSTYTAGLKEPTIKSIEPFLLPGTTVEPDSTYMFPLDYADTWPVSGTALHEARHKGVERLLEDTGNPFASVPNEEIKMRYADLRNGIEPLATLSRKFLGSSSEPGAPLYEPSNEALDTLNKRAAKLRDKNYSLREPVPGYAPPHDPEVFALQQQAHMRNIDGAFAPEQRTYYNEPFVEQDAYNNESLRLVTKKNYRQQQRQQQPQPPQPQRTYYDAPFTPQSQERNNVANDLRRFNTAPDRARAEYSDPSAAREQLVKDNKLSRTVSADDVVRYSTRV